MRFGFFSCSSYGRLGIRGFFWFLSPTRVRRFHFRTSAALAAVCGLAGCGDERSWCPFAFFCFTPRLPPQLLTDFQGARMNEVGAYFRLDRNMSDVPFACARVEKIVRRFLTSVPRGTTKGERLVPLNRGLPRRPPVLVTVGVY